MNEEEFIAFLKKNLKIKVDKESVYHSSGTTITISLGIQPDDETDSFLKFKTELEEENIICSEVFTIYHD